MPLSTPTKRVVPFNLDAVADLCSRRVVGGTCAACGTIRQRVERFEKAGEVVRNNIPTEAASLCKFLDFGPRLNAVSIHRCPTCERLFEVVSEYEYLVNGSEDTLSYERATDERILGWALRLKRSLRSPADLHFDGEAWTVVERAPPEKPASAPALPTWQWVADGCQHSVRLDPEAGDLVWWSEFDPRGDPADPWRQSVESFLAGGDSHARPPAEILAGVTADVLRSAAALSRRPPAAQLVALARRGDVGAMTALLDAGVEIDAPDSMGRTALFSAIDNRRQPAALLLISRGADIGRPVPDERCFDQVRMMAKSLAELAHLRGLLDAERAILARAASPER